MADAVARRPSPSDKEQASLAQIQDPGRNQVVIVRVRQITAAWAVKQEVIRR